MRVTERKEYTKKSVFVEEFSFARDGNYNTTLLLSCFFFLHLLIRIFMQSFTDVLSFIV